jgi:NAD(P)-dependent dehydrogenase (short-subunit alcohol dehydrogenase family)
LARVYRARGATVWGGCRRPDSADELRALTENVIELDVDSEESIERFGRAIGDEPVDVLVNNAGVDGRAFGAAEGERDVLQLSAEAFLGEIRVNALGPILVTRALLGALERAERPRIVNMSSTVGSLEVAATIGRDIGYTVSKAALNMITVKLAGRLRDDGVIAVAIHPGILRTALASPGRETEEVGPAAAEMVDLIDRLALEHSGTFLRRDGSIHPW